MSQLVRSKWRLVSKAARTSSFFDALGIEYRKVRGQDFWQANRHILPELFADLQTEVREKLHELHPDKGGSADEFRAFIDAWKRTQKRFAYNMPGASGASYLISFIPPGQSRMERRRASSRKYARKRYAEQKDDPEFKRRNVERVTDWITKNRGQHNAKVSRYAKRNPKKAAARKAKYLGTKKGQRTTRAQYDRRNARRRRVTMLVRTNLQRLQEAA